MKKIFLILILLILTSIVYSQNNNKPVDLSKLKINKSNIEIDNIKLLKYDYEYEGIKDYCLVEKGETNNYIVVLHGHGGHADELYTQKKYAFKYWYPPIKKHKLGIICFETQGNGWMNEDVAYSMNKMLTYLKKEYNINKTIIAGGSMGGTSTLIYTLYYPKDANAIIANCAACNMTDYYHAIDKDNEIKVLNDIRDTIKDRYKGTPETSPMYKKSNANEHTEVFTMPIYVCHGNADELIPFEYSKVLIDKMKGKPNFNYIIVEGGNHVSPEYEVATQLDWICKKLGI